MDTKQARKTSIYSMGWPKELVRFFCRTAEQENRILRNLDDAYVQQHRHYHTAEHIADMHSELQLLGKSADRSFESGVDAYDTRNPLHKSAYRRKLLDLAILYHDVAYEPFRKDNEEMSCHMFAGHFVDLLPRDALDEVIRLIMLTKEHEMPLSSDPLGQLMVYLDMAPLRMSFSRLLKYEKQIMREFQAVPYKEYREERLKVLCWLLEYDMTLYPSKKRDSDLKALYEYVYAYKPKIGLYAGTFDPFHIGHMDVLRKAEKVFDKVVVFVGSNSAKKSGAVHRPFATRLQGTAREALPYHQIINRDGLLSDELAAIAKYADVTLVRGMRDGEDMAYETKLLRFLEDIADGPVSVVHILCDRKYAHISSSGIRALLDSLLGRESLQEPLELIHKYGEWLAPEHGPKDTNTNTNNNHATDGQ